MVKIAVVKTGGKQYIVKENDEIIVDKLASKKDDAVKLETLAVFDEEGTSVELGNPLIKSSIEGIVLDTLKGTKVRIARFKAKVRRRKVMGFRPQLTKIKITKI